MQWHTNRNASSYGVYTALNAKTTHQARTHAYQAQKQGVDSLPPKSSLSLGGTTGTRWPCTEPSVCQTRRCHLLHPSPVQSLSLSWTVRRHFGPDLASRNWRSSVIVQITTSVSAETKKGLLHLPHTFIVVIVMRLERIRWYYIITWTFWARFLIRIRGYDRATLLVVIWHGTWNQTNMTAVYVYVTLRTKSLKCTAWN